jgi:Ni,Fe-hydrogenase I cytochrome b subunit
MSWQRLSKRILHWLLAAIAVVLLITGLGITEYGIVESVSFGLLTKSLAHKIHTAPALWISFLVLLALHIFFSIRRAKN